MTRHRMTTTTMLTLLSLSFGPGPTSTLGLLTMIVTAAAPQSRRLELQCQILCSTKGLLLVACCQAAPDFPGLQVSS